MTTINLRELYPWYTKDEFVEVTEEVAQELRSGKHADAVHIRRMTRNKAQYSLDREDGIEYSVCLHEPTPQELLERAELFYHLWNALNTLPEVQGRRVDAHFMLGMTYREIAQAEGVDKSVVRRAVLRGLESMKDYLRKNW